MKVLLALSLLTNLILGVLYYKEKSLPPIERIVIEERVKEVVRPALEIKPQRFKHEPQRPVPISNVEDFGSVVERTEEVKKELIERVGITDEQLKTKKKLEKNYEKEINKLIKGNNSFMNLSFSDRRKLLDLEEKLHQDISKAFGKNQWSTYKKMIDAHNRRVGEDYERMGNSDSTMMSY